MSLVACLYAFFLEDVEILRSRCFVSSLPAVAAVLAFSFAALAQITGCRWLVGWVLAKVVLFVTGLLLPCMALRIDERQLYPPNGSVPYSAKPLVESLAIPELLRTDISIFSCSLWLIKEIGGEANSHLPASRHDHWTHRKVSCL